MVANGICLQNVKRIGKEHQYVAPDKMKKQSGKRCLLHEW
jgi:hypothetical protein